MANEVLDGGAVRQVADLATKASVVQSKLVRGIEYFDRGLYDPRKPEQLPPPIAFSGLSSLAAFVKAGQDAEYTGPRGAFLVVSSPKSVSLVTGIFGDFAQRAVIAEASAIVPAFRFGEVHTIEAMIVGLRSAFAESEGREAALRVIGNITEEKVKTVVDDGVTQVVTAKTGIVGVKAVEVPNPLKLRAFRTFPEVGPIEGEFILRMTGGGDGKLPSAALYEADGGAWRIAATQAAHDYLRANVPDGFPIYS